MSYRYQMTVAYDGARYFGWQVQPDKTTVQGELERVLLELTGESTRVHCSGRTDTGVHARGQVAHFDLESELQPPRALLGLNALLPEDIRVLTLKKASADFHSRFSATAKEYRYFIWNGPVLPPHVRLYRTHIKTPLDTKAMAQAAKALVGRNDFAAFSANPNREIGETVRLVHELTVRRHGHEIVLIARGEGFLYKMVRSLAGFLIRVGTGELEPDVAAGILASGVRTAQVPTAPPQGLFLWKVEYGGPAGAAQPAKPASES